MISTFEPGLKCGFWLGFDLGVDFGGIFVVC
jgi:hypothetical protein